MADNAPKLEFRADVANDDLAKLTRDLADDLSNVGVEVRPVEATAISGDKGDPFTLGALVLALVTSGTVKAIIECFKAYFVREHTLTIKLSKRGKTAGIAGVRRAGRGSGPVPTEAE